jgi:hypothetical protein
MGATVWFTASVAGAQACAAPGTVSTACANPASCAAISVGNAQGPAGQTVSIPITFTQGPDDGHPGQGFDEVAAIAFSLGVPGSGDGVPLTFDCTSGNLSDGAVTPGAGIADNFTVVVENAQCTNRSRCLCADTTAGQTVDNFVNLVVYGPKSLPEQGPVQIPVLPSGTLLTLNMRLAANAPANIPLHVFNALGNPPTPQFAANLSIGDQAACDVTANSSNQSNVNFTDGAVTVTGGGTPTPGGCVGDCNADHSVAINELIIGVNEALGTAPLSSCTAFDANGDGMVSINELITAVNNALNGCPTS